MNGDEMLYLIVLNAKWLTKLHQARQIPEARLSHALLAGNTAFQKEIQHPHALLETSCRCGHPAEGI